MKDRDLELQHIDFQFVYRDEEGTEVYCDTRVTGELWRDAEHLEPIVKMAEQDALRTTQEFLGWI